ncbi:hypothetical protein [Streptomyces sedi]|uniref:Uncharacterized protein n=1 Tax=Streptomyces sedi TaxID=555059 RepID=A0A5C4UQI3_9ACTN|nr:hypothetical protein [Streptomyces sedi]TNM25894.1 hypothetical protein FH715_25335 [Streptomyces sedi]
MSAALDDLNRALASPRPEEMLAAAWEAFDVGLGLADAAAWEDGLDELQAVVAGQLCAEGRALLPLPVHGRPITPPAPSAASAQRCATLLDDTSAALTALADGCPTAELPLSGDVLRRAGELADQSARSLRALVSD